jgi:hypothetical protein
MSRGCTDFVLIINMTRLGRHLTLQNRENILIIRIQSHADSLESHLLLKREYRLARASERLKNVRRHQYLVSKMRIHGLSVNKLIVLSKKINVATKDLRMAHSRLQIGALTIGDRHVCPHPQTQSSYGLQP